MTDRHCANPACRVPLVRRDGEKLSRFNGRVACSRACGTAIGVANLRPQLGGVGAGELDDDRFNMTHAEIAALLNDDPELWGLERLAQPMSRQLVAHYERTAMDKLKALAMVSWRAA